MLISFSFGVLNVFPYSVGTLGPRKNSGSHIDASLSRQPLVKGERLVRNEVNAVICWILSKYNVHKGKKISMWARYVNCNFKSNLPTCKYFTFIFLTCRNN